MKTYPTLCVYFHIWLYIRDDIHPIFKPHMESRTMVYEYVNEYELSSRSPGGILF